MPKVIDLMQIDLEAGKHWLAEGRERRLEEAKATIRKRNLKKYLNKIKTGAVRVTMKKEGE